MKRSSASFSGRVFIFIACIQLSLVLAPTRDNPAFAQGYIYGTVQNSDGNAPAESELRWWGFQNDTDREIRLETSNSARNRGDSWFEVLHYYSTAAPGNPFDYYFDNLANGESAHLVGITPATSLPEQNITLAPAANPAQPSGLGAEILSATEFRVFWHGEAGVTYHVYRRPNSNNDLFYRIDDPDGSLDNPGISDSAYIDDTINGPTSNAYVIIGEDAAGRYSPHSEEIVVRTEGYCDCVPPGDCDCDGATTPLDASHLINFVYKGWLIICPTWPDCPYETGDVNCDGVVDPLDVMRLVGFVYTGWCRPCNCCDIPCDCEM